MTKYGSELMYMLDVYTHKHRHPVHKCKRN